MHATLHFVWTLQLCTPPCKDGGEITIPQARQTYFSVWFTLINYFHACAALCEFRPQPQVCIRAHHTQQRHAQQRCNVGASCLLPRHSTHQQLLQLQRKHQHCKHRDINPPYLLGLCGRLRGPWRRPRPPARRVRQRQRQRRCSRACEAGMVSVRGGREASTCRRRGACNICDHQKTSSKCSPQEYCCCCCCC